MVDAASTILMEGPGSEAAGRDPSPGGRRSAFEKEPAGAPNGIVVDPAVAVKAPTAGRAPLGPRAISTVCFR